MLHAMLAALGFGLVIMTSPLVAQESDAVRVALPDVMLPPELDRVLRDYERAWRAGDAQGIAALFTEDGVLLQNFSVPIRGRAAIQAAYANHRGSPLRLRAVAYAVGDTVGYILGGYRYGDATEDMGKFTLTVRRGADGRWLIASDMDSMNAPPTPRPGRTP
jgi:ketosteroid isomerase-like protein